MSYLVFTDGSSRGNPGPGGYGAVIIDRDKEEVAEVGGREDDTTNNRMELRATIEALSHIFSEEEERPTVTIYTDSKYVIHGITKWIKGWKNREWKTKGNTDVLNKDLWEKLDGLVTRSTVKWERLPGHSGVPGNERADEIATTFADDDLPGLYHGPLLEYPVDVLKIDIDTEEATRRKEKKARSRAQAYSYLSLVDGEVCRHKDWKSCEARVKGQKATFRKSISKEDEEAIVKDWGYTPKDIKDCS